MNKNEMNIWQQNMKFVSNRGGHKLAKLKYIKELAFTTVQKYLVNTFFSSLSVNTFVKHLFQAVEMSSW